MSFICENLTNITPTTLATDVGISDPSILVTSSATFPVAPYRIRIDSEIMVVTSTSGNTWFVDRGQEGSTAVFHPAGTDVFNVLSAGGILNMIRCHSFFGSYAAMPMPGKLGRLYFQDSPGWFISRDNGTGWESWAGLYKVKEPIDADYTWVNQGAATATAVDGAEELVMPAPLLSADSIHMRVQNVAAHTPITPPYTVTTAFYAGLDPENNTSCGMVFRESSTGKLIFFRLMYDDTAISKRDLVISLDKYTNQTTISGNYSVTSSSVLKSNLIWMQIQDDNTNLIFSVSNDGQNFEQIDSRSRTDFLLTGPDQIGIGVNSNTPTGAAYMTLISWEKT
jgi:hypothetical protein